MKNESIVFIGYDAIGDYFSYNGMIRYLSEIYKNVYILTSFQNFTNLLFLDSKNIIPIYQYNSLIPNIDIFDARVWEDYETPNINGQYFNRNNKFNSLTQEVNDNASSFYSIMGVPTDFRLSKFNFNRLIDAENTLFNSLNTRNDYSVICEYNGCVIKREYVGCNNIINLHRLSNDLLDIVKVVENAKEIHLVENSIALFIYHLQTKGLMKRVNVNLHAYSRREPHRVVNKELHNTKLNDNNGNFYLNMLLYPKLDNWRIIWE